MALDPPAAGSASDGNTTTEVFFFNTIYGDEFSEFVLGVALIRPAFGNPSAIREADIVINNQVSWNSYRGPQRQTVFDLRRVLSHELGHLLGFAHPDEAETAQEVKALMNSTVGDIEGLVADDIAAAIHLYGTPLVDPAITAGAVDQVVTVGDIVTFNIAVGGDTGPSESTIGLDLGWFFPDSLPETSRTTSSSSRTGPNYSSDLPKPTIAVNTRYLPPILTG